MAAWKFLILLAGIVGLVGFFLPFARGTSEQIKFDTSFTAYRLVRGIDVKEMKAEIESVGATHADAERAAQEIDEGLAAVRGLLVVVYAPAALLALLGAIAVASGRIGRLGGVFALVLGLASAGIWALLFGASHDEHTARVVLATGAHALLVAGLIAILGGGGALFAPDRGE
jgi:hypothetical protein